MEALSWRRCVANLVLTVFATILRDVIILLDD